MWQEFPLGGLVKSSYTYLDRHAHTFTPRDDLALHPEGNYKIRIEPGTLEL